MCVVYLHQGCGVQVYAVELMTVTRGKVVAGGSSLIVVVACTGALSGPVGSVRGWHSLLATGIIVYPGIDNCFGGETFERTRSSSPQYSSP